MKVLNESWNTLFNGGLLASVGRCPGTSVASRNATLPCQPGPASTAHRTLDEQLALLVSAFKLPAMLTCIDGNPIGRRGSKGPGAESMRPRNHGHVSVLMIWGPSDVQRRHCAGLGLDRKGRAGLCGGDTRGSLCTLAYGQGAEPRDDDARLGKGAGRRRREVGDGDGLQSVGGCAWGDAPTTNHH